MPGLSVIIPSHDDEATIRSALQSAEEAVCYYRHRRGDARETAEVIVIDDGSRDGTLPVILDAVQGKDLFRIFHRRTSSSPSSARNCGASLAAGDVLFFLDADDLYLERHLFDCCQALEDPTVDFVKTGVALSDSVHPDWRSRIGNSLAINIAVRRRCHEFIGGFPDVHLFRRSADTFEPWIDIFRLIEDVHYNALLSRFFRSVDVSAETVRYMRRPGNSYDRQYAKFQVPFGSFREAADFEFDFRVRISKQIVEYQCRLLENKRLQAQPQTGVN
jgi:glycosyltransferase involved in cell wall biosynthesis